VAKKPYSTEAAFLQAILEQPDDDTPRLVYADWLEEHGQGERAEFIRLQIERARRPYHDRTRLVPGERERALLAAHGEEWLGPLPEYARQQVVFERGFPGRTTRVEIHHFVTWDARLWRAAPVTDVALSDSYSHEGVYRPEGEKERLMRALAAKPELGNLRGLNLDEGSVTAADLEILLTSRRLTRLRTLLASDTSLGDEGVRLVARTRRLPALTDLYLESVGVGAEGVAALAVSPLLGRLRTLGLSNNGRMGDAEVAVLAASPQMRNLTRLSFVGSGLTDVGARALAASPHLAGLTYLCLYANDFSPAGHALLEERFGKQAVLELVW
jgi:uncharacterized protein (TIGR02996 family)